MTSTSPPDACTVLVVGAGPAGSACAQWLAHQGVDVVLVDQHDFPRDKVCGDGLIPDAHRALERLGLYDEVMSAAQPAAFLGCVAPRGGRVDVPGRLAGMPRRQLDDILKRGAERAGARFFAPLRFVAPLLDGDRVAGAVLRGSDGEITLRARWTVLATGAVPQALLASGMCRRQAPSGIALRGYVHNPEMQGRLTALDVVWHPQLRRGYGWIFPCRDGVFNVGVGVGLAQSDSMAGEEGPTKKRNINLREMFATFCEVYAPARELLAGGRLLGALKGAPLRCSLDGAELERPGLLVTGEAAGSTYAFTGEGIGKAMETGLLAAEALLAGAADDAAVAARYRAAVATLKPRFDLYERANKVNEHPWLADLLIWRARRSARILRRMAGVLEETGNPGNLVSLRGITRLFLPIR